MSNSYLSKLGSTGTKVMVSNLPLLFARSPPTSLDKLKLFLKFVLEWEQNSSTQLGWDDSEQRRAERNIQQHVRSETKACYTYHDCMYLLEFCRKLISFTGEIENLQVVDNTEETRSLLNRSKKKLPFTVIAENQDYDKEVLFHLGFLILKQTRVSLSLEILKNNKW